MCSWSYSHSSKVSDSYEGAERLVAQFSTQRDSTLDACASTIAEGESLLAELVSHLLSVVVFEPWGSASKPGHQQEVEVVVI